MRVPLLLFFFALASSAQTTTILRGVVTDQTGGTIPGATVTATPASGQTLSATAGDNGDYLFRGVEPGSWTVQASAPGFAQAAPVPLNVNAGNNVLNIQMHIAGEHQEVTVTDTTAP